MQYTYYIRACAWLCSSKSCIYCSLHRGKKTPKIKTRQAGLSIQVSKPRHRSNYLSASYAGLKTCESSRQFFYHPSERMENSNFVAMCLAKPPILFYVAGILWIFIYFTAKSSGRLPSSQAQSSFSAKRVLANCNSSWTKLRRSSPRCQLLASKPRPFGETFGTPHVWEIRTEKEGHKLSKKNKHEKKTPTNRFVDPQLQQQKRIPELIPFKVSSSNCQQRQQLLPEVPAQIQWACPWKAWRS